MTNSQLNALYIKEVALALGSLCDKSVFVGGSVVGFYVKDLSAEDVRPTKDVDVSIEIISVLELEEFRKDLNRKGFQHDSEIICRFHYKDIIVDIMGRKPIGWAPANKWFDLGFDHREEILLDDVKIWILSFPFFLATKFEAYKSRGSSDPRFSKDYEDIAYLLDNVTDFDDKIIYSPPEVNDYLVNCLKEIQSDRILQEGIISQLFYGTQEERFKEIMRKIEIVIKGKL